MRTQERLKQVPRSLSVHLLDTPLYLTPVPYQAKDMRSTNSSWVQGLRAGGLEVSAPSGLNLRNCYVLYHNLQRGLSSSVVCPYRSWCYRACLMKWQSRVPCREMGDFEEVIDNYVRRWRLKGDVTWSMLSLVRLHIVKKLAGLCRFIATIGIKINCSDRTSAMNNTVTHPNELDVARITKNVLMAKHTHWSWISSKFDAHGQIGKHEDWLVAFEKNPSALAPFHRFAVTPFTNLLRHRHRVIEEVRIPQVSYKRVD